MPTLPASTDFTGSGITEAEFKTAMTNMRGFLADLLGTAGTIPAAQSALDVIFGAGVTAKDNAYTIATSDRGQLLDCTGTWTLSLPAAATAGAGFAFALRNSGSGVITIDGDSSETVDGELTITLAAGASAVIVCTGTAWLSVGLAAPIGYPISVANGGTGSGVTPTASKSPQADNIRAVKHDQGHNAVGSFVFAASTATTAISPGGVRAGSGLIPISSYTYDPVASTLSGSWRCLGYGYRTSNSQYYGTLWQRIS